MNQAENSRAQAIIGSNLGASVPRAWQSEPVNRATGCHVCGPGPGVAELEQPGPAEGAQGRGGERPQHRPGRGLWLSRLALAWTLLLQQSRSCQTSSPLPNKHPGLRDNGPRLTGKDGYQLLPRGLDCL